MKSKILQLMVQSGARFDANETIFLDRQLEHVETTVYDVKYSKLKAREFVPMAFDLPEWAETFVVRTMDKAGMAKLITSYSDDLPRVDVQISEETYKTLEYGAAFGYNLNELRTSARLDRPIDAMRGIAAREACDRFLDEIASIGVAKKGIKGFLNNTNVPSGNVTNGDWLGAASNDDILDDLFEIEDNVISQSDEHHMPTDMILPPDYYAKIITSRLSNTSDTTIADFFLSKSQSVKNLARWGRLTTAGTGGIPRIVCYEKNPVNVKFQIAVEFEMLEAEKRNLEYVVNCVAKCGATNWLQPLAGYYAEGIHA